MRMLEQEGFASEGYIDIFDGGPTMSVKTDNIRTIREAQELIPSRGDDANPSLRMIVAAGHLRDFVCGYVNVARASDGSAAFDMPTMKLLGLGRGERVLAVCR